MIVLMAGLPGTGKSTLARALAARIGGAVLDKDVIRAALFGPFVEYSTEQDDFCQEVMLQAAAYLLDKDRARHILLDGRTFSRRYQRQNVIDASTKLQVRWAIIECVCTEATAHRRLAEAQKAGTHPAKNRTPELYAEVRNHWEAIEQPKLVLNTEEPLETCTGRALKLLSPVA